MSEENLFTGHADRECGDHVDHIAQRAWCIDCSTACYPDLLCRGCESPVLRAENGQLLSKLTDIQQEIREAIKAREKVDAENERLREQIDRLRRGEAAAQAEIERLCSQLRIERQK